MGVTYTVSRIELKRTLTALGVSDKSIDELLAQLNKLHRHANVVLFAGMLQKMGLKEEDVAKVLRHVGVDDVTMSSVFNMLEEEKIKNAFGRVVEMTLE